MFASRSKSSLDGARKVYTDEAHTAIARSLFVIFFLKCLFIFFVEIKASLVMNEEKKVILLRVIFTAMSTISARR